MPLSLLDSSTDDRIHYRYSTKDQLFQCCLFRLTSRTYEVIFHSILRLKHIFFRQNRYGQCSCMFLPHLDFIYCDSVFVLCLRRLCRPKEMWSNLCLDNKWFQDCSRLMLPECYDPYWRIVEFSEPHNSISGLLIFSLV